MYAYLTIFCSSDTNGKIMNCNYFETKKVLEFIISLIS